MHVIHARNVNDAYPAGLDLLHTEGRAVPSRNGPVIRVDMPVTTHYSNPQERVLFNAQRNCNPFFHLFESLWMLHGDNDVAFLAHFLPSIRNFSDDGVTFHAAYGDRWRHWPSTDLRPGGWILRPFDQLERVIAQLQLNPDDRRVIVAMWDPARDLNASSKDIPCNDLIKFNIIDDRLNMQVYNRSNDIVFGAYGANAVHLSFLQEYIAGMIGHDIGHYWQISGDYHAYVDTPYQLRNYYPYIADTNDPYRSESYAPFPLVHHTETFNDEFDTVIRDLRTEHALIADYTAFDNRFFHYVVQPMYMAHHLYKTGAYGPALLTLKMAQSRFTIKNDWLLAGYQWIDRARERAERRTAETL